jgi:hypothetical protein
MNTKEFIKKYLLDNGYGVYATIVDAYHSQIKDLKKPARFRRWLAEELDVPVEKINLKSLNSAVQQQRKKGAGAGLTITDNNSDLINEENSTTASKTGFKFSKPSSDDDKNSRIREM